MIWLSLPSTSRWISRDAMHNTASVFINDDESGLHHDDELWLEDL